MLKKIIEKYNNGDFEVNTEKTQYMDIGGNGQDIEIVNEAII